MTYRAKPVVRPGRSFLDRPDRRNFLLNLGFGLVVVVAVLVLLLAAGLSWWDQHLKPVASVNGQGITKDDVTRRYQVEQARLAIAMSRINDERNAGRLTEEQASTQLQFLGSRGQQLPTIALERLIDARVQASLAAEEGITITDQDVQAAITREATRPEQRHVQTLDVAPTVAEGATEPTPAAKAEAKKRADDLLAQLRGGKSWEDVAKELSSGGSKADGSSDLGWVTAGFDSNTAFADAIFALDKGGTSDVFVDEDGTARIGRVVDILAESVAPDFAAEVESRGVSRAAYEQAVRDDLPGQKLRDKIEQAAVAAGPQREVREIYLENTSLPAAPKADAVKARHILIAPKDDPQGAAKLKADDPAWKAAEDEARKVYDEVTKAPDTFDAKARAESDEDGADVSGGKLPWFDPSMLQRAGGQLDDAFGDAVFAPGLQPGQIVGPVRSAFGWHVIQIMYTIPDQEQAQKLKDELAGGAKFADLARDYSSGPEAGKGGERGWIARYQLDPASEKAIFETPIGQVTDPVVVDGDGVHLYLVEKEENRTPDGAQKQELEQNAFSTWYRAKKAAFKIERDTGFAGPVG